MIKRNAFLVAIFFILILCVSCGGDAIIGEDWDEYAEVYGGPGPGEDFEKLFLKIKYGPEKTVSGEFEGPFYAKFEGNYYFDLQENKIFHLESTFRSNECMGKTRIEFDGEAADGNILGILSYNGCQVFEFFYEGEIVGGQES